MSGSTGLSGLNNTEKWGSPYGLAKSREVGLKLAAGKVTCIAVAGTDVAR